MCRSCADGGRRCDAPGPGRERHNARRRATYAAAKATALAAGHDSTAAATPTGDPAAAFEQLVETARLEVARLKAMNTVWFRNQPCSTDDPALGGPDWDQGWTHAQAEVAVTAAGAALDARIETELEAVLAEVDARFLTRLRADGADLPADVTDYATWQATMRPAAEQIKAEEAELVAGQRTLLDDRPDPTDRAAYTAWSERYNATTAALADVGRRRAQLERPDRDWRAERAALRPVVTRRVLAGLRDFGPPADPHPFHAHSQKPATAELAAAFDSYPTAWVEASANPKLPALRVVRTRGRAHYIARDQWWKSTRGPVRKSTYAQGAIPKNAKDVTEDGDGRWSYVVTASNGGSYHSGSTVTMDGRTSTAVHEFAHRVEHALPALVALEEAFLDRRCAGEQLVGYHGKGSELTTPDGFADTYVGKRYDGSAFEVLSTGMEAVMCATMGGLVGDAGRTPDRDHRAFVLGCLLTV